MKKKLLTVFVMVMICALMLPTVALAASNAPAAQAEPVTPVDITPDYSWYSVDADTYTISSVEQLAALGKITNGKVVVDETTTIEKTDFAGKTVKLGADLTFADNQFWYYNDGNGTVKDYRIGKYRIGNFAGAFDGQNFTISGLKFHNSKVDFNEEMYLFYTITADGSVSNLTLDTVTANVNGYDNFGFIAKAMNGVATNCHVKNVTVVVDVHKPNGNGYISSSGAMFGSISCATVTDCTAENVKFTCYGLDNSDNVGALIGHVSGAAKVEATPDTEEIPEKRSTIKNCSVKDITYDFTCKTKRTGGFVGNTSRTDIVDCTATNINISVDTYYQHIGGFAGYVGTGSVYKNCTVVNCVLDCNSTNYGGYVGGFAGYTSGSDISFNNCAVTELDMDMEFPYAYGAVGGFTSVASGTVTIDSCSVVGDIAATGTHSVPFGGFVGNGGSELKVNNSTVTADVTAPYTVGGFIGNSSGGTFTDCGIIGDVTSTNGVAGGFVGYASLGAEITFVGNNTPAANVSGVVTNAVANAPDKLYEIDGDGNISYTTPAYVCRGTIAGAALGFLTIQEAVDTGATTVTLLANSTEGFVIDKNEAYSLTLALGEFTYNGVITVLSDIKNIAVTGTSTENKIVVTEPFKDHSTFIGWCHGVNDEQNLAPKVEGGYELTLGETYHTHWEVSDYVHLTPAELHPDFGTMSYKGDVPAAQTVTFKKTTASETDEITGLVTEADYFDLSFKGLTLTIIPKADLAAGTYEEIIHVIMSDHSTHGVTAKIVVEKGQAVIDVDTSDIVVIKGNEWQLPTATSNVGAEVKLDKLVSDMSEDGVYTVTYTVEETDNYFGAQKQIKVTVITNPAEVQEKLDEAIKELNTALNGKASAAALTAAINSLSSSYDAADAVLKSALQSEIDADVAALKATLENADKALQAAIDKVAADLATAKSELNTAIANGDSALDKKITALENAYKAADAVINSKISEITGEDTTIKASLMALENSLTSVKSVLEAAIADVQTNLNLAKAELAQKDAELSASVESLNSTVTVLIIVISVIGAVSVGCVAAIVISFMKKSKVR